MESAEPAERTSQLKVTKAQTELATTQRLALSMAILTQVYLAYHDYKSKERQYDLAKQLCFWRERYWP